MDIRIIENQHEWTTFFNQAGSPSFHQSWEWGEFQRRMGYSIIRLGVYEGHLLQAIALAIHIKARRGNFIFIPHGPLFSIPVRNLAYQEDHIALVDVAGILRALVSFLSTRAKALGCAFIRIAPCFSASAKFQDVMREIGCITSPIYMHAETMWVLDITPPEEELLAQMRKNTRYAIRKGLKDAIVTYSSTQSDAPKAFWEVYTQTFTRESFTPFSQTYITHEFEEFQKNQNAEFIFGELPPKFDQEGPSQITAASLVIFTKSTAFYHQGASIHTPQPVPYMVQWATIAAAKKRGCQFYNLYGIHHAGRTPSSWEGLSLFKRGFGGFELNYLETQDYVLSNSYYLTNLYEKYLNWRRGVRS